MNNTPRIATVSQINGYIKKILDSNSILNNIWIKGEISNFKAHYSGHLYITLKDEKAVLKAVMFRSAARNLRFMPQDGMKVLARGRLSVYEAGGAYQLYIEELMPDGIGSLHIAYEQLKRRLEAEGLFAQEHKKPLKPYPEKVGVITAPTGAAVRDIINVITRRFPHTHIILYPAAVQGADAAPAIVRGLRFFNERMPVDTIIVGRGGGSIEDLWAFNEEIVARAIYESEIPVISAVGHETDFTIADFVADLRAPTPSAAAEMAVPSQIEIANVVGMHRMRVIQDIRYQLALWQDRLDSLDVKNPKKIIADYRQLVDKCVKYFVGSLKIIIGEKKQEFAELCSALDALSPLAVIGRGYAIPIDDDNKVIKSVKDMECGREFNLKMSDGDVRCTVKQTED